MDALPTPTWPQKLWHLFIQFSQVPSYHLVLEAFLVSWVIWLLVRRVSSRERKLKAERLTKEEEEELIADWRPEPLVPDVDPDHPALHVPVVDDKPQRLMRVEGHQCLNLATHNYLGFAGNPEVEQAAVDCMKVFGVGSCGPRAFLGTADVHVHLEEKLAKLFGAEQAVLYSYGFSTIASAIPAYAKKGDIIFVDEGVNFAIQKGLDASRSRIKYFKHNDAKDLEHLLMLQANEDSKNPKLAKISRRFLIVEGIYMNSGQLCNLLPMVELKHRYKLRLFIDETISFGTIGNTGRGILEHFNLAMDDVDLLMAMLENAIGSIGGFAVGTTYVVEHQTLAGLGYCFSASLPPMLAAGALKAIELMEANPEMCIELQNKCKVMHELFSNLPGLKLIGDPISPVKHLRLRDSLENRDAEKKKLRQVVSMAREEGVALVVASYLEDAEAHLPPPSIRLTCSVLLTMQDLKNAADSVDLVCQRIFVQ